MFCMYSFEFQNVYLGSVSISLVNLSSWVISRQILSDSSKLVGKWHYLGHGPNLSLSNYNSSFQVSGLFSKTLGQSQVCQL